MKNLKILLMGLTIFCFSQAQSQESVNTSGGEATGSGGTASYTIGETVYTTNSNGSGTVAQGVQHAYEIFTVGLPSSAFDISLRIFPNPTVDNLTLQISNFNQENLSYLVYDMQGKLVANGDIESAETQISVGEYQAAAYFIHVVDQNNEQVQTFKIIKQ